MNALCMLELIENRKELDDEDGHKTNGQKEIGISVWIVLVMINWLFGARKDI